MRGVVVAMGQIVGAALLLAVGGGLIGLLIAKFAISKSAVLGLGWGMIVAGAIAGLGAGGSGSPSTNLLRGRSGYAGTYWGMSAATPQSPVQVALGGVLAFAAGVALLVLSYSH